MRVSEFQKLAMRTNDRKQSKRLLNLNNKTDFDLGGIINGCLGLCGESGEFTDMIKKWIFHETPLDLEHAKRELGDILWYITMICESFDWNLEDIMDINIEKLKKRYPNGFDTEKSNNRKEDDC